MLLCGKWYLCVVYLNTLLEVSDIDSFCLKELSHDVSVNTHTHSHVTKAHTIFILSVVLVLIVLTLSCGQSVSSRR